MSCRCPPRRAVDSRARSSSFAIQAPSSCPVGSASTRSFHIWVNAFSESRSRLLRGRERLSEKAFTQMWNDLVDAEPTGQLLGAWIAKEELRALLSTARRGGQRHDIAHRLFRFYDWCARVDIPEVTTLATTIEAWWPEILGFLQTGI